MHGMEPETLRNISRMLNSFFFAKSRVATQQVLKASGGILTYNTGVGV